jgi:hypothetical protein
MHYKLYAHWPANNTNSGSTVLDGKSTWSDSTAENFVFLSSVALIWSNKWLSSTVVPPSGVPIIWLSVFVYVSDAVDCNRVIGSSLMKPSVCIYIWTGKPSGLHEETPETVSESHGHVSPGKREWRDPDGRLPRLPPTGWIIDDDDEVAHIANKLASRSRSIGLYRLQRSPVAEASMASLSLTLSLYLGARRALVVDLGGDHWMGFCANVHVK